MMLLCVPQMITSMYTRKGIAMMRRKIRRVAACVVLLLGMLLDVPKAEAAEVPYFLLNESSYTVGAVMEVSLFHYDVSQGDIFAEIIWSDMGSVVFRTQIASDVLTVEAPLHSGTYVMRIWQGSEVSSRRFTVSGDSGDTLILTGSILEDESDCAIGIRLKWQEGLGEELWDGGAVNLVRIDEEGNTKSYGPMEAGQFIDVNIAANKIYSYTLITGGETMSNSVVITVDGAVPSETSEDKTFGYIELEVGNSVMIVNGNRMEIDPKNSAIMPKIVDSRVILPISAVVKEMGGTADWDAKTQTVTLGNRLGNIKMEIPIGSTKISVNGQVMIFEVPARIEQGRTFVPIRHVEQLDCRVSWHKDTRSVTIRYECENSD